MESRNLSLGMGVPIFFCYTGINFIQPMLFLTKVVDRRDGKTIVAHYPPL